MEEFLIRGRILTLESDVYALAIAIVFCLGIYSLSTLVQDRWLGRWRRFDFWSVHVGTSIVVVLWCSFILDVAGLFHTTLYNALLSVPTGIGLGWAAIRIDRTIVRDIARRDLRKRTRDKRARGLMLGRVRAIGLGADLPSARQVPGSSNMRSSASRPLSNSKALSTLWVLILIGAFEEIIFRGFLVEVCFMIPQPAVRALALAGTVVVFGVGHVQFGWTQVFAKVPLGVLAMASVLLLQTVIPAILIHTLFNWRAWRSAEGDLRVIFRPTW
jgi:membrane protease YdiL (CAAX protease family)